MPSARRYTIPRLLVPSWSIRIPCSPRIFSDIIFSARYPRRFARTRLSIFDRDFPLSFSLPLSFSASVCVYKQIFVGVAPGRFDRELVKSLGPGEREAPAIMKVYRYGPRELGHRVSFSINRRQTGYETPGSN